jgi:hypothetical protein
MDEEDGGASVDRARLPYEQPERTRMQLEADSVPGCVAVTCFWTVNIVRLVISAP